jgi:hypothetical protein
MDSYFDMPSAEQPFPPIPHNGGWYRGFLISYDPPPIPDRDMDWHAVHRDFDGAPDAWHGGYDPRRFDGPSAADCARQINEYYDELESADEELRYRTETGRF